MPEKTFWSTGVQTFEWNIIWLLNFCMPKSSMTQKKCKTCSWFKSSDQLNLASNGSLCWLDCSPPFLSSSFSEDEIVLVGVASSSLLGVVPSGRLTGRELVTELDGRELAKFWKEKKTKKREGCFSCRQTLTVVIASINQMFSDFYRTSIDRT